MKDGSFEKMFKQTACMSRLISIVFDKAHHISQWGNFCCEFKKLAHLRYLLPHDVPIVIASATLPPAVLSDIIKIHHLCHDKFVIVHIRCSNERPNIRLVVQPINHTLHSLLNLAFLTPEGWQPGTEIPPVFTVHELLNL